MRILKVIYVKTLVQLQLHISKKARVIMGLHGKPLYTLQREFSITRRDFTPSCSNPPLQPQPPR
jgi:hypothetical protein